jgi:hypothetical protein
MERASIFLKQIVIFVVSLGGKMLSLRLGKTKAVQGGEPFGASLISGLKCGGRRSIRDSQYSYHSKDELS